MANENSAVDGSKGSALNGCTCVDVSNQLEGLEGWTAYVERSVGDKGAVSHINGALGLGNNGTP